MSPVEIKVLLTQADRHAYMAAWTQRMQRTEGARPLSWLARYFQRPATPDAESVVLGPCTMRFETTGIRVRTPQAETLHDWATIVDGTSTPHHLFLWADTASALIVPIRDLPSGMTVKELQEKLEAIWTTANSTAASAPPRAEVSRSQRSAKTASAA